MPTSLSENWLELAASHGATQWVKGFIQSFLPSLREQSLSPGEFAQVFAEALESRGLLSPAQQKNYRSNLCQALKVLDPNHPAIVLIAPTTQEYRDLNDAQRGKLAHRETQYFTSAAADALVERATALLESAQWSEVGAGLAVLIGRRISEILLSDFSLKSSWSLSFSEMAKKAKAEGISIEIPTLAPAELVLTAIHRLQKSLRIDDLKLASLSPKMAKQTVNGRFSHAIADCCDHQFSDLIPKRTDRDNLYTHVFRAVYATIAAHWFCPLTVPEHLFKAEIQGHFSLTQEGKKLPNYSARANYDDYAIGTEDGNRDGRLGIQLGRLPYLQVIDAFRKEPPLMMTPIIDKNRNGNKDKNKEVERDPDNLSHSPQVEAVAPIDDASIVSLLPSQTIAPPIEKMNPVNPHPQKGKTKRPELHADDLAKMTELMAKQGVVGNTADVFHSFLDAFETDQIEHQQQHTQTIAEVAQTLNWFTAEIQALRTQVSRLEQERDQLVAQSEQASKSQDASEQVERLQAENTALKAELHQTRTQLEGIQQLLGRGAQTAISEPSHPIAPLTTNAAETTVRMAAPTQDTAQPAQPKLESTTLRRNRTETTDKINQAIDAIMSWNTAQDDPDTQLRISIPTIKGLVSAMGANYQPAIQEVLKERADELENLHRRLLLGTRHNASVKGKDEVLKAIARDYLALDNWNHVKYTG